MITIGDLVLRFIVCLAVFFFLCFLLDVWNVLRSIGFRKTENKPKNGTDGVLRAVESDETWQTVSFHMPEERYYDESDMTCDDKENSVVYRVNLSTGRYTFRQNRQGC